MSWRKRVKPACRGSAAPRGSPGKGARLPRGPPCSAGIGVTEGKGQGSVETPPSRQRGCKGKRGEHAARGGEAARGPRPCRGRGRPGPRPRGARHEGGPLAGTRAGTPHAGARRRLAARGGLWRGTSGPDAATAAGAGDRETPRPGKLSSPRPLTPRPARRECPGSGAGGAAAPPPPPPPRARPPPRAPPAPACRPRGWVRGAALGQPARPRVTSGLGRAPPPHPAGALPAPAAPPRSRPAPPMPGMSGAAPGPPRRRHPDSPGPSRSGSHLPACFRQPFPLRAPHPPPPRDRDPERAPRTAAAAGPATPPPPRTRPGPAPRPTHCAHWLLRLPVTAPAANRAAPGVSLLSGRSVLSTQPIGRSPPHRLKRLAWNQRPLPTHSQENPPSRPKQSFLVGRGRKDGPIRTSLTRNISSRPRRSVLIGRHNSVSQAVQTNQRGFPELGNGCGKPRPPA